MSKSLNSVNISGNVTRTPELKYSVDGVASIKFSLAVNGYKEGQTSFINCIAFKKTAEIVEQFVKKGQSVIVSGYLSVRRYEKDGKQNYITEVVANEVIFGAKRDASPWKEAEEPIEPEPEPDKPSTTPLDFNEEIKQSDSFKCEGCMVGITGEQMRKTIEKYGKQLCFKCEKKEK